MITLRPLSSDDQVMMQELLTNDRIKMTYMLPDFEKKEDAAPLFRRLVELSRDERHFVRGICTEDRLAGFLNDVEISDGTIELGYVIHPDNHNKGYATAALKAAIAELFRMGYREVVCGAFADNPASIRVMEKAGMLRQDRTEEIEYRGKQHSCVYYGIVR